MINYKGLRSEEYKMTTQTAQPSSSNLGGAEKSARFLGTRGADPDFRSLCRAPAIAWPNN